METDSAHRNQGYKPKKLVLKATLSLRNCQHAVTGIFWSSFWKLGCSLSLQLDLSSVMFLIFVKHLQPLLPTRQETVSHLSTFKACQGEHDAVIIYHYTPIALNRRQEIYETSGRLCNWLIIIIIMDQVTWHSFRLRFGVNIGKCPNTIFWLLLLFFFVLFFSPLLLHDLPHTHSFRGTLNCDTHGWTTSPAHLHCGSVLSDLNGLTAVLCLSDITGLLVSIALKFRTHLLFFCQLKSMVEATFDLSCRLLLPQCFCTLLIFTKSFSSMQYNHHLDITGN